MTFDLRSLLAGFALATVGAATVGFAGDPPMPSHDHHAMAGMPPSLLPVSTAHTFPKLMANTLKDIGKTQVFSAKPPFKVLAVLDTGPITNHVNFARTPKGQFAYVKVGGLNAVKVHTTDDQPRVVATIPMGGLPHGLWPSGDGSLMAVGLENANAVALIDTASNTVKATIASGQAPQGMVCISNAVPRGDGMANLVPLGAAAESGHLSLVAIGQTDVLTTAVINNQGLVDIVQAAVTGLEPKKTYFHAASMQADGSGALTPIAKFMSNPAGAAIVGAVGALSSTLAGNGTAARADEAHAGKLLLSHLSPVIDKAQQAVSASIAGRYKGAVVFATDGLRVEP